MGIQKFFNVHMSSMTSGAIQVALNPVTVGLQNGKAGAGGKYCGVGGHADGTASAKVSFTTTGNLKVKGTVNPTANCVKLDVTGSGVDLHNLKIHDPYVKINLDGLKLPGINANFIVDLINELVPEVNKAIADAVAKAVNPELVKVVNGLPCMKIP